MNLQYFQNYFGMQLSEEDYQNISNASAEMFSHVIIKTVQMGTTLGTLFFGPLIALSRKKNRTVNGLKRMMTKSGKVGAAAGLVLGKVVFIKNDLFSFKNLC